MGFIKKLLQKLLKTNKLQKCPRCSAKAFQGIHDEIDCVCCTGDWDKCGMLVFSSHDKTAAEIWNGITDEDY